MTLLPLLGVLSGAIFSGASLLYATLGEIVGQRSGVINLGLEGTLLISAASGFAATYLTGNPYVGMLVSMLAGGLTNMILGYLVINRQANQLASGLTLMFFGFGLSAMIGKSYVGVAITGLPRILLPFTSGLGRRYTSLLSFDILIYLAVPAAVLIWWLLFRTRWGLGLRAAGENADMAFSSGRDPKRIRYQALCVSGLLASS
jgi:simple sugar transport system permease protein